jgi:glycosyltransferase involved in cell wall biosynthesis
VPRELPSFDLVVATVGRKRELARFLDSLAAQGDVSVRVLLVDQNPDDGLDGILAEYHALEVVRLRSTPGLSRARNVALEHLEADVVAFPDDDCVYPPGLLGRVAERFAAHQEIGGLTGRAVDASGRVAPSWKADPARLTRDNLWNRAISFTIFLRRTLVERVGPFDVRLGLGSSEPWSSGEEIDYLIRALRLGARIEYDPALGVQHDLRENVATIGLRDGASVGYLLRKHGYPARTVGRMLVRPVGGAARSLTRLDASGTRYQLATLRGRLHGYLGASRSNSSA